MPTSPHTSFLARLLAELPCLPRAACRLTRSEQDAEDLAQATIVRALAGRGVGCTRGPLGNAICARSVEQPVLAVAEVDVAALAPALGRR